jgi:hypothetical protein
MIAAKPAKRGGCTFRPHYGRNPNAHLRPLFRGAAPAAGIRSRMRRA